MKKTPLCSSHERLGAKMVDFSGWCMPVQYDGIMNEHHRTRNEVTMFDTCHMGRFMISGSGAVNDLSRLVTQDARTLKAGRCRYGFLLRDDGGILDDLIVYRLDAERFMVVVNAGTREKDFSWFDAHLTDETFIADVSETMSKIDVQGPQSAAKVSALLGAKAVAPGYFGFAIVTFKDSKIIVSRTGYTGETGYEIYADTPVLVGIWESLLEAGVKPAGLGARDTLRLEAGLPLYGHELTEDVSPVEAGMMRYASKNEDFIGKMALKKKMEKGFTFQLIGFKTTGRQTARNGNRVHLDGRQIGWVTSGSYAPSLGYSIGMAYIETAAVKADLGFEVDTGRNRIGAVISLLPFYRKEGKQVQT